VNVFFNVQNLFDKDPPAAAFYGSNTIPGLFGGWPIGDDPMGRYFTLGVRISL
jgi:outer membrane receptor protein involved in Fe transport